MVDFLLEKHNPWWADSGLIKKDITLLEFEKQPLKYHHPFLETKSFEDGVIVIRGPRRIGKTTLIKLIIQKLLLHQKIKPAKIFFYPCDRIEDYNGLYDLLINYLSKERDGRKYIFLDEISFVREWQRAIKDLWDSGDLKSATLILTGSNALDLKISSERLPGRRGKGKLTDIEYLPLTFSEFTSITGKKRKTKNRLADYLISGGFPQAINEYYSQGFIPNYLYETYLSWIEGDIHKTGKSDTLLYAIASQIYRHLGSSTSWYRIAKNTGIGSHSTVFDYIDIFQKLFISFSLNHYAVDEGRIHLGKNKKIYFFDPIIYHAIRGKKDNFSDQFYAHSQEVLTPELMPSIIENIVAIHLKRSAGSLCYGRIGEREVDFVINNKGKEYFYEVKYQNNIKITDFAFWNKKETLTVITKNFKLKRKNLSFIPVEEFLLGL